MGYHVEAPNGTPAKSQARAMMGFFLHFAMWEHMQRCSGHDGLFGFLQVVWDSGKEFVGNTPTAPFAKLALFIGTLDVTNGIMASFLKIHQTAIRSIVVRCSRVHIGSKRFHWRQRRI